MFNDEEDLNHGVMKRSDQPSVRCYFLHLFLSKKNVLSFINKTENGQNWKEYIQVLNLLRPKVVKDI